MNDIHISDDLKILPERTCCFTGHRPASLGFAEDSAECARIKARLREEILRHVALGVDTFITGMAQGVDTWAGEICARLRREGTPLRLIAARPCPEQMKRASGEAKRRYDALLAECDAVVTVSPEYTPWCNHDRDRFMVDNSRYVIGVYNGADSGGTYYTLRYARKLDRAVTLLTTGTILDLPLMGDEPDRRLWREKGGRGSAAVEKTQG
ncbi:MAG: DUF1273 family protein [Clostridia bacterium]|nr:DUF1273 family protein [Clostridia bacterium]